MFFGPSIGRRVYHDHIKRPTRAFVRQKVQCITLDKGAAVGHTIKSGVGLCKFQRWTRAINKNDFTGTGTGSGDARSPRITEGIQNTLPRT